MKKNNESKSKALLKTYVVFQKQKSGMFKIKCQIIENRNTVRTFDYKNLQSQKCKVRPKNEVFMNLHLKLQIKKCHTKLVYKIHQLKFLISKKKNKSSKSIRSILWEEGKKILKSEISNIITHINMNKK